MTTLRTNFWSYVDRAHPTPEKGCWLWKGQVNASGYGYYKIAGQKFWAHRTAYSLVKGGIRRGYEIDHMCCVRICCNPFHLEQVTPRENKRRILNRPAHKRI